MGKSRESKGNYVNRLPPQDFESFYLHFSEGESNQKEFTPAEPVPPPPPFLSVCLPLRSGMPWEFCLDKERSPCHPWKGVVISESIAGAGREGSTLGFSLFQLLKLEFHKSKNLLTAINLAERTAQNWSSKNIVE